MNLFAPPSDNTAMTSPNADKDLLILCASRNRSALAPVLSARSEPIRSMNTQ